MPTEAQIKVRQRHIEGAKLFAAADKSDPFTFARAMTHINVGICNDAAAYEAEAQAESRSYEFSGQTVEYVATGYRNLKRP